MAKYTRSNFVIGAAQALQQQNFPAVYKSAIAALALGSPIGASYLCAYYRHQIVEGMKVGFSTAVSEATRNFCIMYQVSKNYKVQGYQDFTDSYQRLFDNPKAAPTFKKTVSEMARGYIQYLQVAQMQYSEGTAVDIPTAECTVSAMEQIVVQQVVQNSQAQALEMSAPPPLQHDPHHHHDQTPLLGQQHEKCWDKLPCVLL